MTGLRHVGKPYRALCTLKYSSWQHPLSEQEIWRHTRENEDDTTTFYAALERLVGFGYARRIGSRGCFRWYITDAGREFLDGVDRD